jgi:hypothetical protein
VITTARQIGFTVGVAIFVAVLGAPAGGEAQLHAFRHGWYVAAAAALLAAPIALLLVHWRRPAGVRVAEVVR